MRALAIFGPNTRERELAPFRVTGADITALKNLEGSDAQRPAEAVLVLGGDGTVQRHLPFLLQRQIPLLVVPTGSANDFARALGLRTRQAALRAWHKFVQGGDNIREIDVGVMQFAGASGSAAQQTIYFCCAAGIGVDAAVARRANRLPGWLRAHGGYFLVAIPALIAFRAQSIRVVATAQGGNSRVLSEPGILVAIANAPWYGHGMRIAPRAELNDAQLEVCFVRETGKLRLLRLFPKVYRGTHIGVPEVEYFRAEHVRIESEPPLAVHADGELAGYTPLEVSLLPRALRVIV